MDALVQWVTAHPQWAELLVFLVALAESLAVIGLLVPGVAMMFGAGALIGNGALGFWSVCIAAILGAVAGDGLSFWLGLRYEQRLRNMWPFRSRPDLLKQGESFFIKHGGFSVFLGRFFGPVRAVIPLVAGMMRMPTKRFLFFNIGSALLWGPAYLLPGMAFGASLDVAGRVAGRLVVVLAIIALGIWGALWVSRLLHGYFRPKASRLILQYLEWVEHHPYLERLTHPLLWPGKPESGHLFLLALMLILVGMLVIPSPPVLSSSAFDYGFEARWLQPLLAVLASGWLAIPGVFIYLALLVQSRAARRYWLIILFFALAGGALGKVSGLDEYILRGGFFWGGAALLMADIHTSVRWSRWMYGLFAVILVLMITMRAYLGDAPLYLLISTFLIPAAWLLVAGTAYHRHRFRHPGINMLVALVVGVLLSWAIVGEKSISTNNAKKPIPMDVSRWLDSGWHQLPEFRNDVLMSGAQRLNVQWASSEWDINEQMSAQGWTKPTPLRLRSALYWLNMSAKINQLPLLPQPLEGHLADSVWVKLIDDETAVVLRLWQSEYQLTGSQCPIWSGRIALLKREIVANLWVFLDEQPSIHNELSYLDGIEKKDGLASRTVAKNQRLLLQTSCDKGMDSMK